MLCEVLERFRVSLMKHFKGRTGGGEAWAGWPERSGGGDGLEAGQIVWTIWEAESGARS